MIFPGTPEIVRKMVTVAHLDLEVVKELLDARLSRARAALDWGFGDWKTAPGGRIDAVACCQSTFLRRFVYCSALAMLLQFRDHTPLCDLGRTFQPIGHLSSKCSHMA